jgi:hypothetical protein
MKKITLLIALMITSLGFAQPLVTAPTPPVRNASDVISIFSGAYTNVSLAELPTGWSQLGTFSTIQVSGDDVWKITACEFLGMVTNYASGTNLSTMEKMHIDYFTPDPQGISVKIVNTIDGGEAIQSLGTTVTGSWQSVDIDMSTFAVNKNKITQILIDPASPNTLYIDNFYFYKASVDPLKDATLTDLKVNGTTVTGFGSSTTNYTYEVPSGTVIVPQITAATTSNGSATKVITQASAIPGSATVKVTSADATTTKTYTVSIVAVGPPTAAPTPPARPIADVVSIYSDAYTNIPIDNFDAGWCGGPATTAVTIGGNNTLKKITGVNCQGIDFQTKRQNLTDFTYLHFDFYITDTDLVGDVFNLKLVNFNGGAGESSALEVNINGGTTPQLVANQWVSVDVPITALGGVIAGSLARNDVAQIGITTANVTNVWYDNIYLHKNTVLGTQKFETSTVKMYPNPVKNTLTIDANSAIQRVSVYNILGQEVLKASPKSNSVTLQTNELQKGVYMVTTEIDGKVSTSKVVKE